jgi:predicted XRE-type DNA-binding protein
MSENVNMSTEFMQKLVTAKKIMNKVESGNYERGHINTDIIFNNPEELIEQNLPSAPKSVQNQPTIEKIKQSKLPNAIKQAMIDNPIPSITLNDGFDIDIIQGAKRLMEQEGLISKTSSKQNIKPFSQINKNQINNSSIIEIVEVLKPIIENIVRKTITEILDAKLTQILTAQETKTINENLILKVGNSIFNGKITGVKKTK